jgi:lactoylglutathione lyase
MNTATSAGLIEHARLIHTMIRVRDLDRSLDFYGAKLGMRLLRRKDFPEGRFTVAFIGYGEEDTDTVIELTHNWGDHEYTLGTGFGHIALGVADVYAAVSALADAGVKVLRPAGPLKGDPTVVIAFIEDPDGYRIELVGKA